MENNLKKKIASVGLAASLVGAGAAAKTVVDMVDNDDNSVGYVQENDDLGENQVATSSVSSISDSIYTTVNSESAILKETYTTDLNSATTEPYYTNQSVELGSIGTDILTKTNHVETSTPTTSSTTKSSDTQITSSTTKSSDTQITSSTAESSDTQTITSSSLIDSKSMEIDYDDCYNLMLDTNGFVLDRFISKNLSLSDMILSSYKVDLSSEQKSRYDTLIKNTYDIYNKGIEAYRSGDMDLFKSICDDVLNTKKYFCLDDFVDIISIGVNQQGDYIKNSKNYSFTKDKLIIDGYSIIDLLDTSKNSSQNNIMSFFDMYVDSNIQELSILKIMQVPNYTIRQCVSPCNYTLMNNNTVYSYDNDKLREKFEIIKNYYDGCVGLTNLDYSTVDGKTSLVGYDKNHQRVNIEHNEYAAEIKQFSSYYDQFMRSFNSRVGYFDGEPMKKFLAQYDMDIKVSEVNYDLGLSDFDCYSLMQDTIGFSLSHFMSKYSSLSEALVSTYNVNLTDEQKARYDTVLKDTYDAYEKAIVAYESGNVQVFRGICNDVLNSNKYLCFDDLVDILSININSQEEGVNYIKNSHNYSFNNGELIIDGAKIESLIPDSDTTPQSSLMSFLSLYKDRDSDDLNVLTIMQVPNNILREAFKPTSFSLSGDGILYAYDNDDLKKKFDDINDYFTSNLGLTDFCLNMSGDGNGMYYGYDKDHNKQYIDSNNEYLKDLSRYIRVLYPAYQKSIDGRVGYFDGRVMRGYIEYYNNLLKEKSK